MFSEEQQAQPGHPEQAACWGWGSTLSLVARSFLLASGDEGAGLTLNTEVRRTQPSGGPTVIGGWWWAGGDEGGAGDQDPPSDAWRAVLL